ncbi:MAG: ribose-phosphate diphosphokinase [Nitrosopumilus sp. B06]|nr:MAG: ribose-phosphate diphosphokinase [Nitrosopumilus sp. D6]RNJ80052.1 MAG: ribose-phosphate diphosphokinase [Nitrosopumilus sp. B06]
MLRSIVISDGSDLAGRISRRLGARHVRYAVREFPDGESKITLRGKIQGRVIVVKSVHPPVDTSLLHALSLIAKAREESAEVIAVVPYMGYARQDREFLSGEIVTMRVLGRLFRGAGASKVIVVDIHSTAGLRLFPIRTINVTAIPALARHVKKMRLRNLLVVSPDRGGAGRAKKFAAELGAECMALEKKRDRKTGRVQIRTKDADVSGRDIVLVDDMISTGGSIAKAAQFLKKHKCRRVYVACTHALLIGDAKKNITRAGVAGIISANTIPGGTSVDVSEAIVQAIRP